MSNETTDGTAGIIDGSGYFTNVGIMTSDNHLVSIIVQDQIEIMI